MAVGDKGRATRESVLAAATKLFAKSGYAGASIEDVLAATGLSRGALYYHFPSKEKLFEAVCEALEAAATDALKKAARDASDPVEKLRAGCDAFLKMAADPTVRQILLIDAPAALGWEKWRDIEAKYGFGLIKSAVQAAAAAGRARVEFVDMFSHAILAATLEIALVIARSDNPKAAMRTGRAALAELIGNLLASKS